MARDLDFVERTNLAEIMTDYSLSRAVHASSLFYGVDSYNRDLGVAAKGDIDVHPCLVRYFLMVGNGLGANMFISGATRREYIITNRGQFFYGARLELADFTETVTAGGHFNYNRHDDIVFNSGRVVFDLDRLSYSADLRVDLDRFGVRTAGMYGAGLIRDDYDDDGRIDLDYSGWETRLIWTLNPMILAAGGSSRWERHFLALGARYDSFISDWNESNAPVSQRDLTFLASYRFRKWVELQLNYVRRQTDDPSFPDLDDDILLLQIEAGI
jgi:hypothetical protein